MDLRDRRGLRRLIDVGLDVGAHTVSRRFWPVPVAVIAAMLLSACHYDPYRWPRPGQASATALENQLNERDSLQDAAKDLIAVAAAMRDAAQRAYPATQWTPKSDGDQGNCGPPFIFLTGSIYELPNWQSSAPASAAEAEAVIAAVADVLKAHHAEKIDQKPERSVTGVLPREHGELEFTIRAPVNGRPPEMVLFGKTGCHHAAPGQGPWNTSVRPAPTPAENPPPSASPPPNIPGPPTPTP
jgi:hypothetical protein